MISPRRAALVCAALEAHAPHFFTTREWRLGASSNDDEAWKEVADAIGVEPHALTRVRQVHGAHAVVAAPGSPMAAADIVLTDDPSSAVAVQSADCVPLLIADQTTGAVAAAHAGWRGLAARVPEAAIDALARHFHARSEDLIVAAGPSIGACCYEVGPDVREAFVSAGFSSEQLGRWFLSSPSPTTENPSMPRLTNRRRDDRWFFDGWATVGEQLQAAGVKAEHIFPAGLCTASHPARFCSYRRDGAPAGRMAAVIRPRHRLASPAGR